MNKYLKTYIKYYIYQRRNHTFSIEGLLVKGYYKYVNLFEPNLKLDFYPFKNHSVTEKGKSGYWSEFDGGYINRIYFFRKNFPEVVYIFKDGNLSYIF